MQKLYLDFWEIPIDDIRHQRDGIYGNKIIYIDNFIINLILLDTRYFRSDLKKTKGINYIHYIWRSESKLIQKNSRYSSYQ